MKLLIDKITRAMKRNKEKRRLNNQYGVIKLKPTTHKVIDTTVNLELFESE